MHDIEFFQSKNIKHYKQILQGLDDSFEQEHWSTILCWCGIIDNSPEDLGKYWQVWLLSVKEKTVGFCGLFSTRLGDNSELWLGWFAVLPQYRNLKIGGGALSFMEHEGKRAGAKKILSYVRDEDAIRFYERNGFESKGTVEGYILLHPDMQPYLGEPEDRILVKNLV